MGYNLLASDLVTYLILGKYTLNSTLGPVKTKYLKYCRVGVGGVGVKILALAPTGSGNVAYRPDTVFILFVQNTSPPSL